MVNNKRFQKRKIKAEGRLRRREQQKLATVNILIVGEGVTEYNYFNDMQRNFRGMGINLILRKPTGSAPISIVDTAINYSERNEGVDYAFCVFDRDEHTTFDAALDKLRRYRPSLSAKSKPVFKAITSEPCFEIWILLHFTFSTKSYSRIG